MTQGVITNCMKNQKIKEIRNQSICIVIAAGMEISTQPLAWASVKSSWASTSCEVFGDVLKVNCPYDKCCQNLASNPVAGDNSRPQTLLTSLKWYELLLVCHLTAHASQTG